MNDRTTYFFADNATLHSYLTMASILTRPDIDKGFVLFNSQTQTAVLGFELSEDSDQFGCNLLNFPSIPPCMSYQTPDELDQAFNISDALRLGMLEFDICQTKSMASERSLIAREFGIDLASDKTHKSTQLPLASPLPPEE